ncbi:Hsp70 family protein [Paenarthrobacter sp. JL.01a]|uniref:Hsp70 family protein n=1 Tax=Paenarthrobacter sp. JL.01a TaxID=2979324 RepID=UPI0021C7670D|nr:Hsp70 family protein [Paenarthrobacter sp. JL.01a]UXM90856.1 Hsp70 family protein [Paenarthrobacter sp. JL.01a]
MSYVLAIDVGTSYTAAALLRPSGSPAPTPEILPLGLQGSAVPSVLYYTAEGRILVGEAAERRGLDDPGRMVREFKRRIGDAVPLAVGESWLAPEDVYATLARWVVDRAEEREGSSPSSIIMTHPASWGGHRTATVLASLNLAGLTDVTLISEPVAAAVHYAAQTRVEDGSTVAVYDLGGGTFDTAVLRKTAAGTFELLGRPDGIETLGGADFDAAVLRHVIAHLGEAMDGLDPEDPESKASLSRLRRECREAKEALSMDSETSIAVALPGTQRTLRLVRSEFETLIEAPIRETVHALERSLRSINVEPAELSAVLLIGGSSRIPLVAGMISVELDRPIAVDADPKSSICLGAAIAGAGISAAMDAQAVASAVPVAAPSAAPGAPQPHVVARPHLGVMAAAKSAATPGHAPRARLRLAAAAVTAATALTIATATAAQTPEGNGLLASMFGNQAADVMRGDGTTGAGAHANGGGGGAPGAAPAVGSPTAGLEASAGAGVTRTGTGKSPARSGKTGTGGPGTGAGTGQGSTAGSPAGSPAGSAAGTGGAAGSAGTGGTSGTPGTGGSTGTNGAPAPGTPGSGTTTPTPEPTGGAASGPTPPPATTPPTVPPPASDPTTPPVVTDPSVPPPSTDPVVPQPEPTAPQNPVPPSPEPTVPQQEPTQPANPDPAPVPSETSPNPDPALTPAV